MNRTVTILAAGLALAATLSAAPAQAQNTRSFVSGLGSDSNPCTLAMPCRSFQAAHNATNAGGEIAVLDTAGYGAVTITKAISIVNPGGVEAGISVASGGVAITINATTGTVALRGLTIEGAGVGEDGIVLNTAGALEVVNCAIRNFKQNGILLQPSSGPMNFVISNTIVTDNGYNGINYEPSGPSISGGGVIDHVLAANNTIGIDLDTAGVNANVHVTISNSVASNNAYGMSFYSTSGQLVVDIDSSYASNNGDVGINGQGTAVVLLGRSVVSVNGTGINNNTSSGGEFNTYGDNRINWNSTDINGGLNTYTTQ
jgi:parallel beta helix pectate lyase-like protein